MAPKYMIGQKVRIKPADSQHVSARDSALDEYAGQTGKVINYYWLNPRGSEVFYVYLVTVGTDDKEIALHEDEIEADV